MVARRNGNARGVDMGPASGTLYAHSKASRKLRAELGGTRRPACQNSQEGGGSMASQMDLPDGGPGRESRVGAERTRVGKVGLCFALLPVAALVLLLLLRPG